MRRLPLSVLVLAVGAMLVASGCGGGSSAGTSSAAAGSTPAQTLCADVAGWSKDVQTAAGKLSEDTTDAQQSQQQLESFIGDTLDSTQNLLTKVQQDTVPADSSLESSLESALQALVTGLQAAKVAVAALPDQAAALQAEIKPLKDTVSQLSSGVTSACAAVQ
jgi:hypothetical protein